VLDERIPLMVWISCSYTILSIVVSAMEAEKSVLGALSSRQNDCLATLIRLIIYSFTDFDPPTPLPPRPPSERRFKQNVPSDSDLDASKYINLNFLIQGKRNGAQKGMRLKCNFLSGELEANMLLLEPSNPLLEI
jgi:hypothetical protein